jgi:hypothetical protein
VPENGDNLVVDYPRSDIGSNGTGEMDERRQPLVWLHGEVKTPPFFQRRASGVLLQSQRPAVIERCKDRLRRYDEAVEENTHMKQAKQKRLEAAG